MKIHTVMWHDSGGRIGWPFWEDLQAMSEFMALMGHDVVIYDRDKLARDLHGESEVERGLPNLFDAETSSADPAGLRLSYDCDVLFVMAAPPVRFGGKVTHWDEDVCDLMHNTRGKVCVFVNEALAFNSLKNDANEKWGRNRFDVPFIFCPTSTTNSTDRLCPFLKGLCNGEATTVNQTWAIGYKWIQEKGYDFRPYTPPKADFFYGGVVRPHEFRKTFDALSREFESGCWYSYGEIAKHYGFPDMVKERYGKLIVDREKLVEITSECRFSFLPYDRTKDYVTTKALENGVSNSLVLADPGYNSEGLKFETVDLQDIDAIKRYMSMSEDNRLELVEKQHKMLEDFDFYGKMESEFKTMEQKIKSR